MDILRKHSFNSYSKDLTFLNFSLSFNPDIKEDIQEYESIKAEFDRISSEKRIFLLLTVENIRGKDKEDNFITHKLKKVFKAIPKTYLPVLKGNELTLRVELKANHFKLQETMTNRLKQPVLDKRTNLPIKQTGLFIGVPLNSSIARIQSIEFETILKSVEITS